MPPERRPDFLRPEATAYRATSYDVPFWASPNRRNGRWNIAEQDCVQYLALDAEAPWAQLLRAENLRTEEDAQTLRATIWQVAVDDQPIADYSTFEKAEASGFPPEALVDDDYEPCQTEARRLAASGFRGVLAPSAALAGSLSLTLFGPRVAIPWDTELRTASTLRAQPLATGHPPAGLTARDRFHGEEHSDLVEFLRRRA